MGIIGGYTKTRPKIIEQPVTINNEKETINSNDQIQEKHEENNNNQNSDINHQCNNSVDENQNDKDVDKSKIDNFFNKISTNKLQTFSPNNTNFPLFNKSYITPANNFNFFHHVYSCIRFEVLLNMKGKPVRNFMSDQFNFRIYFNQPYYGLANYILTRAFSNSYTKYGIINVFNLFPVIYDKDRKLIMFVQHKDDNLLTEYLIKMYLEGYYIDYIHGKVRKDNNSNEIVNYQTVELNTYDDNIINSIELIHDSVIEQIIENIELQLLPNNKTAEYYEKDLCSNCVFRDKCITMRNSLLIPS